MKISVALESFGSDEIMEKGEANPGLGSTAGARPRGRTQG